MSAKVYTRTGDRGTTGLADGSRVPKDSLRIESYGTIDELNTILGICRHNHTELPIQQSQLLNTWLSAIQNDLFNLGSDLATTVQSRWDKMILIDTQDVTELEKIIDYCQATLPALREFILPGGTLLNANLHLARTVCRRAERQTYRLAQTEEINPSALPYLNRLSDLMFVLARWVQEFAKTPELTWSKQGGVRSLNADNLAIGTKG